MSTPPWPEPALGRIASLVTARAGMIFDRRNLERTEHVVWRMARKQGHDSLEDYLRALLGSCETLDALIAELTVNETWFFRDPVQLALLEDEVLPALETRVPAGRRIRLWSAGCATGEEPWSLAMLLHELGLDARSHVLATDISRRALETAQRAIYHPWSLRGAAAERARRWLHPVDDASGERDPRLEIDGRLRHLVEFRLLNLADPGWPDRRRGLAGFHVILCRNVLMYLDGDTRREVAARLLAALEPGGWLLTSPADPAADQLAGFERVTGKGCTAFRRPPERPTDDDDRDAVQPDTVTTERPGDTGPREVDTRVATALSAAAERALLAAAHQREAAAARDDTPDTFRAALAHGDVAGALRQADALDDAERATDAVRALADVDERAALELCTRLLERFGDHALLWALRAVLELGGGHVAEAGDAARATIYLDPELPTGHLVAGTALALTGNRDAARRAFRNAAAVLATWPADHPVPLADGSSAEQLRREAQRRAEERDANER